MFRLPEDGRKIFVSGHRGLVGRAVCRALEARGLVPLVAARDDLDLTDRSAVFDFFVQHRPALVFHCAGRVGGILDNTREKAAYLGENILMGVNLLDAAHAADCARFMNLGSSCIYPRDALSPIREEALLSSVLEPSNEGYALAKISILKLCSYYAAQYGRAYFSVMPCNLYGPYDRFDPLRAHVLPAMMAQMHRARAAGVADLSFWGSGRPLREFLHVDDLAAALLRLAEVYAPEDSAQNWINIGGEEISIAALAAMMADVTGYGGRVSFDPSMPDGVMRKRLDCSRIQQTLGWGEHPDFSVRLLREGIASVYAWYCSSGLC